MCKKAITLISVVFLLGLVGSTLKAAAMVPGKFGNAAGFSGSSSDKIYIVSEPEFNSSEKSIEFWVKLAWSNEYLVPISRGPKVTGHWEVYCTPNEGYVSTYIPDLGDFTSTTSITDDQWHFISLRIKPNQITLAVDGNVVINETPVGTVASTDEAITLGGLQDDGTKNITGEIDDLRFSDIYRSSVSVPTTPLTEDSNTIQLWDFDDPNGFPPQGNLLSLDDVDKEGFAPGPSPVDSTPDIVSLQAGSATHPIGPTVVSLNGIWQMAEDGSETERLTGEWTDAITATVPGSVHTALVEAEIIPDPTIGFNAAIAKEKSLKTWWFKRTFTRPLGTTGEKLVFGGVCPSCTVWLNGVLLGSHEGMFGGPEYDISSLLNSNNTLIVKISPIASWSDSVVFNCVYGWHYVDLPARGIWQPVKIEASPAVKIKDPFVVTQDAQGGIVDLCVTLETDTGGWSGVLTGTIEPDNFSGQAYNFSYDVNSLTATKDVHLRFTVPNPQLWWPVDLGEHNLYHLKLSFTPEGGGQEDYRQVIFGIRTVKMASLPGGPYPGKYNWIFVINGRPMFVKGANWCTLDALMDFSYEKYNRFLTLAADQHIQLLRCWGSGMVETDTFYDIANRKGIMVLQEWPTAWNSFTIQPYVALEETVRLNTLRLRNNPSLVMWGGGNESTEPFGAAIDMMGRYSYELDGTRAFHRAEPWGGSRHDYSVYWGREPLDRNLSLTADFIGEFGVPSVPNYESVQRYLPDEEKNLWPAPGDGSFANHTPIFNTLDGDDMNRLTQYSGYFMPNDSMEKFIFGSQLAQATGVRHTLELARTRWPDSAGIVYYKLTDVYPGASWASVDWYGAPKLSYYIFQDSFAPLHACVIFSSLTTINSPLSLPVYILDDANSLNGRSWEVTVRAYDSQLSEIKRATYPGSGAINRVLELGEFSVTAVQTDTTPLLFVAEVDIEGVMKDRAFYWTNYNAGEGNLLKLPTTKVNMIVDGNNLIVTNDGSLPAVGVHFNSPGCMDTFRAEDSFFWLDAGESKSVAVNQTEGIKLACWNMASLIGYWPLNEGVGMIAGDVSGSGNNGTIYGAAWEPVANGHALHFDGINDYVEITNAKINIGSAFTIACWVKTPQNRSNYRVLLAKGPKNTGHYELYIDPSGEFRFYSNDIGDIGSGIIVDDNTWRHLAVTFDGSTMKFYQNGYLISSASASGVVSTESETFVLGRLVDGTFPFLGLLDEVRIYDCELTADEIIEKISLIGYWLIGNGGFDSGDLTGWALGAEATATVAPDATAPSAPYIVTFSNGANPETSYLAGPGAYPVLPNHVYSVGYYLRDIDGTLDTADNRAVFEDGGYQYTCTANSMTTATSNWQNIQRTKLSPSNATGYFYNSFRIATPNGSVQADSFYLEDVTYGNRMPNGGFENSSTNLLNWSIYNATANTMTATIVTGAGNVAEGQNALLLSKTTADDSALHIDDQQLPWRAEDHAFQLLFSVKDVPTISVGDYVRAVVGAFDAAGNWNGWTDSLLVPAGIGSYANYSQIFSNLPDDTASITMNFRIKDAAGADIAGDVLLDNVQVVVPEPVTNLIENGGFDSGDLTDWALGAEATATVAPDATAPSAPYIVTFSNGANPETSYLAGPGAYPVLPNHVYSVGYYLRDIDGTLDTADNRAVFEDGGYQYTCTANSMATATSNWQNIQRTKLSPSNATGYFYNSFRIATPNGSVQADSFYLEDVTYGNRMPNGGFENSSTNLLNWSVYNPSGIFHADIVTNAESIAEGKNAVRLYKTSTADGALHKDFCMLPWQGNHILKLVFSVKDDPTVATGEYLQFTVASSDSMDLSGYNGFTYSVKRQAGTGAYSTYTEIIQGIPASTKAITMNLRITDASGNPIAGDIFVDGIQIYDMGEPVSILPSPLHWGYNDLNSDGKADTLAFKWNNKTAVYVADDGQLPWGPELESQDWNAYFNAAFNVGVNPPNMWNPVRETWGNYTILVDRNENGRFDDNADFYYKALDLNHDGSPEAEYYHLFPGTMDWSNKLVVNLDGERDMSYLDWQNFFYTDEQRYLPGFKYIMNVHGSGFFLNSYSKYVQNAWENPIAWYDFDFDGRTNMVMRAADTHMVSMPDSPAYRGDLSEFEIAFELNGNTSPDRYESLDMQLTYYQYDGVGPSYQGYIDHFPLLAGLPQAAFLSENMLSTRQETIRRYFPYMDGYKIGTDSNLYAGVWLFFDEDDDDCRWEEMFNVHETNGGPGYSDRIGDRGEQDPNFAGKGKLYVSPMDGKIHLYQASQGWWEIDYLSLYKGSMDRLGTPEGPEPPVGLWYPQVRYYDNNRNGFIDRIEYCKVRYKNEDNTRVVQKVVDLLAYATPENPNPDVGTLFDPRVDIAVTGWRVENWDGHPLDANDFANTPVKAGFDKMYAYYGTVCDNMWSDATKLYNVARKYKLNKSENLDANLKTSYTREELAALQEYKVPDGYSRHINATGRRDKYNNGYWLKEKVFADILAYSDLDSNTLQRLYYTDRIDELCEYVSFNTRVPIAVDANAITEAPEGVSDSNWRVSNVADGKFAAEPYYPDMQWMAHHAGQTGYDIWCRIPFSAPLIVNCVELQSTKYLQPNSFPHVKDVRLEFSNGANVYLTMSANDDVQSFNFAPIEATWIKIHILSNYGDGNNAYENSMNNCGFSEVILYEPEPSCRNGYYLPADFDQDCYVNFADFAVMAGRDFTWNDLVLLSSEWLLCNESSFQQCVNSLD